MLLSKGQHRGWGNDLGTRGLGEVMGLEQLPRKAWIPPQAARSPRAPQGAVRLTGFVCAEMCFAKESEILLCFSCLGF